MSAFELAKTAGTITLTAVSGFVTAVDGAVWRAPERTPNTKHLVTDGMFL
ncbi:MAG TPA: hypothetical protein VHA53_00470 [Nitrolancea sp.]|nr:hypothetical protein [Nitrolancea sp.]